MLRPKTKIVRTPFLGINKRVDPLQLNEQYFLEARNVDFYLDGIKKRIGYLEFCDHPATDPIIRLCNYFFSTGYYLLGFTKTKLTKYDVASNSFQQIGTNTYSSTTYLCYDIGFNSIFFTNYIDRVKYWNVTMSDFADVPGLNDAEPGQVDVIKVKCLSVFSNFLVIANTVENGNYYTTRVRWSRYGDFTLWKNNPDGTGMAGYFDLQAESTGIVQLIPLGNLLLVCKPDAIYGMRFVGTPYIFVVEKLIDDIGLIAPFGYTYYLNNLVFVGNDNIYMFNGSTLTPIGDNIANYFFNTLNTNRINSVRMFSDPVKHLVYLFYPTSNADDDYCDRCLVFNTELKSWTIYDIDLIDITVGKKSTDWTWDTTAQSWDSTVRAWEEAQTGGGTYTIFSTAKLNKVLTLDEGNDYTDLGYGHFLLTKHISFENLIQVKRLYEIKLIGEGLENLRVTVYYSDDPLYFIDYQTFDVPEDGVVQCDISAKFFQLRFELKEYDKQFKLITYYLRFSERGLR